MKVEKSDREILFALDFHARDSMLEIAKKLRMGEDTLSYRIKRLERLGLITKYYLVPDTTKLGLVSYKIMLKYQNITPQVEKELLKHLAQAEEVGWIVKTDGYYDLMFISWVKNEFIFDSFLSKFLEQFSEFFYIRDMVIITENHACQRAYLSSKKEIEKKEVYYAGEPKNLCDEKDRKIIGILMANAREPSVKMAQKLGLTPEAISYRIKKLKKIGAIGAFRPRIDLGKLGYQYYNVLFRLKKTSVIPKMFAFARQHPNVTYFVRYLGTYDIGFDIEVDSPAKFREVINDIVERFGYGIINYNHVLIYDELKITY